MTRIVEFHTPKPTIVRIEDDGIDLVAYAAERFPGLAYSLQTDEGLAQAARLRSAKAACGTRIYRVASAECQMNMAAAAAIIAATPEGSRTSDDTAMLTAYRLFRGWVDAMRATVDPLASGTGSIADDSAWPVCPAEAINLTVAY
ncbi:hypothetical protein [Pararhizobium sp. O133]|uniref:hypothetical protein n=1 Tax=Pararhizobium sp. O133 TaxID=3449278 RepID=UPI003F687EF0